MLHYSIAPFFCYVEITLEDPLSILDSLLSGSTLAGLTAQHQTNLALSAFLKDCIPIVPVVVPPIVALLCGH